ncbi:hypothetical protein [Arsenicibacter rosenii]|nr:hypothetical protein [Arsenicibacter rosenii]
MKQAAAGGFELRIIGSDFYAIGRYMREPANAVISRGFLYDVDPARG